MLDALIDSSWKETGTTARYPAGKPVAERGRGKGNCSQSLSTSTCCAQKPHQRTNRLHSRQPLFLADLALGGGVILPPPKILIFDVKRIIFR